MKRVVIALVGGQPMPIYSHTLDVSPDILVLADSKDVERDADIIEQALKLKLPGLDVKRFQLQTVDLVTVKAQISNLLNLWASAENEVTVNITGGTKPWGLILFDLLSGYDNVKCEFLDQNNKIWNMKTLEHRRLSVMVSVEETFNLFRALPKGMVSLSDYDADDERVAEQLQKLYKYNKRSLNQIAAKIHKMAGNDINGRYSDDIGKNWIELQGANKFKCHFKHYRDGREVDVTLDSPHAARLLFSSHWFEFQVAKMLQPWPAARKVWLNISIRSQEKQWFDMNEIDILVETNFDKLLLVECKTAIKENNDFAKYNDVVKTNTGLASKRIFVTFHPMREEDATVCDQRGIPRFTMSEIKAAQQAFFRRLNEYMTTINAR